MVLAFVLDRPSQRPVDHNETGTPGAGLAQRLRRGDTQEKLRACIIAREAPNPEELREVVPAIIETFAAGDPLVAAACASTFKNLGAYGIPALLEALHSPAHREWTFSAIHALPRVPPHFVDPLLGAVLPLLNERTAPVRHASLDTLATFVRRDGVASGRVVPSIAAVLFDDPDPEVQVSAVEVLAEIGSPDALVPLRKAAQSRDVGIRRAANKALASFGQPQ
jgi:HEAT repeat protein